MMMLNKGKWDGLSVIVHAAFMYFFLGVNKMLIGELVSGKCGGGGRRNIKWNHFWMDQCYALSYGT